MPFVRWKKKSGGWTVAHKLPRGEAKYTVCGRVVPTKTDAERQTMSADKALDSEEYCDVCMIDAMCGPGGG
jgi:hypothetical protein